ncbi:MAG: hypothetical protein ACRCZH_07370 [Cetobacterium sp.]
MGKIFVELNPKTLGFLADSLQGRVDQLEVELSKKDKEIEELKTKHDMTTFSLSGNNVVLENLNKKLYEENMKLKKEVEELSSPGNVVGAMMESIDGKPRRGRKPKESV